MLLCYTLLATDCLNRVSHQQTESTYQKLEWKSRYGRVSRSLMRTDVLGANPDRLMAEMKTADSVAELAASYDPRVQAMFDHNHALVVSTELRGFEYHVDEMEAEAWLVVHRPHLVQKEA